MALWIVATPLGTLGDASPHMRDVLGTADLIACEDTRTTRKLLSALSVRSPKLVALHAHNEDETSDTLARRALEAEVALVSDAGTPCVSDPGTQLVARVLALGGEVRSVPGPSALASALAASGFPAAPSCFLGFAPRKSRSPWVESVLGRPETLVIYEAPGRITDLVAQFAALAPTRPATLCREISKRFEQIVSKPLSELASWIAQTEVRGECVLVIGPGEPWSRVEQPLAQTDGLKDVAEHLARRWGCTRREAYQKLLAVEAEVQGSKR